MSSGRGLAVHDLHSGTARKCVVVTENVRVLIYAAARSDRTGTADAGRGCFSPMAAFCAIPGPGTLPAPDVAGRGIASLTSCRSAIGFAVRIGIHAQALRFQRFTQDVASRA